MPLGGGGGGCSASSLCRAVGLFVYHRNPIHKLFYLTHPPTPRPLWDAPTGPSSAAATHRPLVRPGAAVGAGAVGARLRAPRAPPAPRARRTQCPPGRVGTAAAVSPAAHAALRATALLRCKTLGCVLRRGVHPPGHVRGARGAA